MSECGPAGHATMLSVTERVLPSRVTDRLRSADFTYSDVGGTRSGAVPRGYGRLQRGREIGTGAECFDGAVGRLLGWEMHRRAGLRVRASSEEVGEGDVAVLRLGVGPLGVDAPVRIAYVVDEPTRKGFGYGTLPGHPESGEEAFVIDLRPDDVVTFTITAFSRPASLLARVGGPVGRGIQSWVTSRYLLAL